ncbi:MULTISPECIES: nucleotidyltransferase domain-containing protein [unclassified Bradyrhizobium]|uniref:nucleotidyltransferase domain-containing protein n=1 Tax=unclassified Bradyrhizobium TaxID=2631580 RepID=UPI0020B19F00|nr:MULTISPECIES: nucleotidyltransferase domain-containing protein [unclassified Bradyrhizobium]MCP3381189.1 nucleotidyltransferase domain-containing protein [Bradyrhizobium sp. CCGUVB4N]MCP3442172.1 nucleotidyltransferase domain-containing protein [Bradyrhizobium sp. CCGUVB14]
MPHDPLLTRLTSAFAEVPGIAAIVLGGSRARGSAHPTSDYDIGLYFTAAAPLDTERLLAAAKAVADNPAVASVTPIGEWGPWIIGGAWLSVEGHKVDLLYRNADAVEAVMEACHAGAVTMDYQPGHPHGFCSAIWMGEIAYCEPMHDPQGLIARLKSIAQPYPEALRDALIRRFRWEVLFGIENAELAIARDDQTHVAGCIYRSLACTAQVLFALNARYLINEKGALLEAARLPLTIPHLAERANEVWQLFGDGALASACQVLRDIDRQLQVLTQSNGKQR